MNAVESGDELRRPRDETAYALIARMERARLTEAAGSNPAGGTQATASGHEPARSRKRRRSMTPGDAACRDLYYVIVALDSAIENRKWRVRVVGHLAILSRWRRRVRVPYTLRWLWRCSACVGKRLSTALHSSRAVQSWLFPIARTTTADASR